MSLVLNAGADPMAQDNLGGIPVHKAIAANQVAMARMVLQKGVDISVTDHTGLTAWQPAAQRQPRNEPMVRLLSMEGHDAYLTV